MAKQFQLLDSKGKLLQDLLSNLMDAGMKDPRALLKQRKAEKLLSETTPAGTSESTGAGAAGGSNNVINILIDSVA